MKVYLADFGVLIPLDYDCDGCYSCVYDKKHGYYDEYQEYSASLDEAIKAARDYVTNGVNNTYAVISESSNNFEDMSVAEIEESPIQNESYSLSGVVYSIAKINNEIEESFITK